MISVIIPTCDRPAEFLRVAVASALNQNLAPSEVLVVDNGTRDADPAALPAGVTLYRLPPRVGPSRARNFGAAMARGSHLAFLDDDDWWDADFLRAAWAVLAAEDVRCVYGRKDVWRDGTVQPYKRPSAETLTIPVLLQRNPCTGGQNVLIDKALYWRVGGFDERLRASEDRALALEVLRAGERIAAAPEAVAVLRTHQGARLRHSRLARLPFVWKYRALLGRRGTLRMAARIIWASVPDTVRTRVRPRRALRRLAARWDMRL